MIFDKGSHAVFIGDSITDCGRRGDHAPYGDGYMALVRALVTARHPELGIRWTNTGISGNTVRDLAGRWEEDAVDRRPDWLTVFIGINDVWRAFAGRHEEAVPIGEYEETLRGLLRRAVDATGCRLVLMTPYLIEADRDDPWRAASDGYGAVVAKLAGEFDAILVDTQAAFDAALAQTDKSDWANDRVHPWLPGHAVLAEAYLAAIA